MNRLTLCALLLGLSALVLGAPGNNRVRRDYHDQYECLPQLDECLAVLDEKIYNYGGMERINAVKRLGAQEICEDAPPAGTCLLDVMKNCAEQNPEYTAPYASEAQAYQYLCTEKFQELSEHWDCITNPSVLWGYFNCKSKHQSEAIDSCSHSAAIGQCVVDIAERTRACGREATSSLRDIVEKVAAFGKRC